MVSLCSPVNISYEGIPYKEKFQFSPFFKLNVLEG